MREISRSIKPTPLCEYNNGSPDFKCSSNFLNLVKRGFRMFFKVLKLTWKSFFKSSCIYEYARLSWHSQWIIQGQSQEIKHLSEAYDKQCLPYLHCVCSDVVCINLATILAMKVLFPHTKIPIIRGLTLKTIDWQYWWTDSQMCNWKVYQKMKTWFPCLEFR